ncbi:MAG: gliding motility-associated C-terminal domain-containing protein [Bacteroidota bacterium]
MKQLTIYPITISLFFFLSINVIHGQFTLRLIVNDGSATTTCTDPFSGPDASWGVNVEGQGWANFPGNAFCPAPLPDTLYERSFQCLVDVPQTIQVCIRAFEDDPFILDPCTAILTCQVEECFDVAVTYAGSMDYTLELPDGFASDGEVNITLEAEGFPGGLFDEICEALDLGVVNRGDTIGDADVSTFNNYCATAVNEPTPFDYGAFWSNEQSIWFQFTTSDDPSSIIKLEARSDPSNLGDPINLQMALFTTDDNTCTGNFELVTENFTYQVFDEWIYFECPEPNKTYFILIDAVSGSFAELEGYFSFELNELGLEDAPNLICDALSLGTIPEGGSVELPAPMTNVCADAAGDPANGAFLIDQGVWFSFAAPSSGHLLIEGISDVEDVPINMQLAVYSSSDGTCGGVLSPYESGYDNSSFDETLEVSCLDPGQTYFLLVDGQGANDAGIFNLIISDAGDDTPITILDETICFSSTYTVGTSVYDQSGSYEDTLYLPNGCDSVVLLDLEILTPLELNFSIVTQGVFAGNTDGEVQVAPTGSAGNYTYTWDNGQTTPLATNLIGGDTYCIVVTDEIGCTADTCFEMPYYVHFEPEVTGSLVDCFGDTDGTLEFTAAFGVPPYLYSWQNDQNTLSGSGIITEDNQLVLLENLPAGEYEVYIEDIIFDTTVLVRVEQPDLLQVNNIDLSDASCFGACDGSIQLNITGGTPPYQAIWSTGTINDQITDLCQGNYLVNITDANGCSADYSYDIGQPEEFIATPLEVQAVSCFAGTDGIASVTTNGTPSTYMWSNGEITETISDLEGGEYFVTVTNNDGCTAENSIIINTPNTPVEVTIGLDQPVTCNGGNDAVLIANITGPGSSFSYNWSGGSNGSSADGLGTGNYSVTVENELGCQATASYTLGEPDEITVSFTTNQLTCNDPLDGGIVSIEQINGGVPPFSYSSDGAFYSDNLDVTGFLAGEQILFVSDAGGCIREFPVTIPGPVEIIVELGNDLTIDLGDEVTLTAQVNISDVSFNWLPVAPDSCNDCSSIDVVPTESGLFSVVVTDQFDCTEVADIFIEVLKKRKVFVPNAFSPNGDGINDLFMPFTGNDVSIVQEFRVFDRQGNNVFAAGNFTPGDILSAWDGQFKGQMMQPGVFVWFAKIGFIDGITETFKGDVTLIR